MVYSATIDNQTSERWGLDISQSYVFSWMYSLSSWAESQAVSGKNYYFANRNKFIEDMPLLTKKQDTVYRYYKALEAMGLIVLIKIGVKDFIRLTEKGKEWNRKLENSEDNPTLGQESDKTRKIIRQNSEDNPTDYSINTRELNTKELQMAETSSAEGSISAQDKIETSIEIKNEPSPLKEKNEVESTNMGGASSDKKIIKNNSDELIIEFERFRKMYAGVKRGLDAELTNLQSKHKDTWWSIIPLLIPSYQRQLAEKQAKIKADPKAFIPEWKHLKTYINQRGWEEESGEITETPKQVLSTTKYKYADD